MTTMDIKRMEAALRERDGRLALIDEITKRIRRGETVDAIVRATIEGVAPFFPRRTIVACDNRPSGHDPHLLSKGRRHDRQHRTTYPYVAVG